MANIVNAILSSHLPPPLPPQFFGMQMWHLLSLP